MLIINDLSRRNQAMGGELAAALQGVLESGWYVLGGQVAAFEEEFAAYCGAGHCISLASGTDALELALRALGVGPGDQVLTVANAGGYSTTAILAAGACPRYLDIEPANMLLSVERLRSQLTASTKAVVVTHLYGQGAPVEAVVELTRGTGIAVIEDCAQAHGAVIGGRRVGTVGAIGCFSFYPTKNLGALGDGGAVITDSPLLAERVRALRQYGWQSKYRIDLPGGRNSRLDELQAAVLRVALPKLEGWNSRRKEICRRYLEGIHHPLVALPHFKLQRYVGHLFVIRTSRREELREHLKAQGIQSEIHYPIPDHRQPALKERFRGLSLPATELACREVLTLPCFPELTDHEVARVIEAVNGWGG